MTTIKVALGARSYDVVIEAGVGGWCRRASTVRITSPLAIPAASASAQAASTADKP